MDLDGSVAVVTGAAGGIGMAGVRHIASLGATVVGVDVDTEPAVALFDDLGGAHRCWTVDVTDPAAVAGVVARTGDELGRMDVLWLNHGVLTGPRGGSFDGDPLTTITYESYRRVFDVNVGANVALIEASLDLLGQDGGGHIVITASGAGLVPFPPDPLYTASKHAVVGLVRSLAPSLQERGVRINAVCPGGTDTPMSPPGTNPRLLQPPVRVAEAVVAILDAGVSGETWFVGPGLPTGPVPVPRLAPRP